MVLSLVLSVESMGLLVGDPGVAMGGMALEVGLSLKGKVVMEQGDVELGPAALEMGLEGAALNEGGVLKRAFTGLSVELTDSPRDASHK